MPTQAGGDQVMTPSGALNQIPYTFQNIDNFGRFRVLKDKLIRVQDPNMSGDAASHDLNGIVVPFKYTIKFRVPVSVRFNQTNGGTIADIIDNSFHVIANTNDSTHSPSLVYFSRVCYKE